MRLLTEAAMGPLTGSEETAPKLLIPFKNGRTIINPVRFNRNGFVPD